MAAFTVTIVERSPLRCAGLKIRTNMADAPRDCTKLWSEDFGPRLAEFATGPIPHHETYGASIMLDSECFDYWAVAPLAEGAEAPAGMDILNIPGGLYAECRIASLKDLGDAYNHIYLEWIPHQEHYAMNMQAAALERYANDYMVNGNLTVYCPLVEK